MSAFGDTITHTWVLEPKGQINLRKPKKVDRDMRAAEGIAIAVMLGAFIWMWAYILFAAQP